MVPTSATRVIVRVSPNSSFTEVGGRYGDAEPRVLIVRVTAPAVDGRANGAVISALARAFGLPSRNLRLVSGNHSRTKVIEVNGVDPSVLTVLLSR